MVDSQCVRACVCVCVCGLMYVHIITLCVTSRHHVPHETSRHHHRIKSGHSVIIPFDTLHPIALHHVMIPSRRDRLSSHTSRHVMAHHHHITSSRQNGFLCNLLQGRETYLIPSQLQHISSRHDIPSRHVDSRHHAIGHQHATSGMTHRTSHVMTHHISHVTPSLDSITSRHITSHHTIKGILCHTP